MRRHCEECGTTTPGGICPNCQEELYIYDTQYLPYAGMMPELSNEFMGKVREQRNEIDKYMHGGLA
jgi:hypothetical protein